MAEPFTLDLSHIVLTFEINHLGFSATVEIFRDVSADLDIDVENPGQCLAAFVVKAASIGTNASERDDHLRSADFFNVEVHEDMICPGLIASLALEGAGTAGRNPPVVVEKIDIRALICTAALDHPDFQQSADQITALIKNAMRLSIKGTGGFPALEKPAQVLQLTEGFAQSTRLER